MFGAVEEFYEFYESVRRVVAAMTRVLPSSCFAGKLLLNLMDHTDVVRDLTFAPDGSLMLVSASRDKTLRVWDLKDDGMWMSLLNSSSSSSLPYIMMWATQRLRFGMFSVNLSFTGKNSQCKNQFLKIHNMCHHSPAEAWWTHVSSSSPPQFGLLDPTCLQMLRNSVIHRLYESLKLFRGHVRSCSRPYMDNGQCHVTDAWFM